MDVQFTQDAKEFMKLCGDMLMQNEVEHNLILSIAQATMRYQAKGDKTSTQFMVVTDEGEPVMAAAQTAGRSIVLSRETLPAAEKLAEALVEKGVKIPGAVGPSDVASSFTNRWTELTGARIADCLDQIMYALKNVLFPPSVDGEFGKAKESEHAVITAWIENFGHDALLKADKITITEASKKAENLINTGAIAVWRVNGKPVSQAAVTGTENVARINIVFTPEDQRGKGYASAVVAHLSQQLLEQGKKLCCLYADARNPVSNSIYRKIGYEFIGRSSHFVLAG